MMSDSPPFQFSEADSGEGFSARMAVLGVGGAGGNAIRRMVREGIRNVRFIAANTDRQALADLQREVGDRVTIIHLGGESTRGLGAGARPEVGRAAIEESMEEIENVIRDVDLLFIAAGMGGGTGTGAAPVIAARATQLEILTIAVVTVPFAWEGRAREKYAQEGVDALAAAADTVISVQNSRLLDTAPADVSIDQLLMLADGVLMNAVRGIAGVLSQSGEINVDFADVRTVMGGGGPAILGCGFGQGPEGALEAARAAVSNPLVEDLELSSARRILVNVRSTRQLDARAVSNAAEAIREAGHPEAELIFGLEYAEATDAGEDISVTVIATGFDSAGILDGVVGPVAHEEEEFPMDEIQASAYEEGMEADGQGILRRVRGWANRLAASSGADSGMPPGPRVRPDYLRSE